MHLSGDSLRVENVLQHRRRHDAVEYVVLEGKLVRVAKHVHRGPDIHIRIGDANPWV